jgi:hypothetical protein
LVAFAEDAAEASAVSVVPASVARDIPDLKPVSAVAAEGARQATRQAMIAIELRITRC